MFQFETMTGIRSARDCLLKKIFNSISIFDHFSLASLPETSKRKIIACGYMKTMEKLRAILTMKTKLFLRAITLLKTINKMRATDNLKPIINMRFNLARVKGSFIQSIN